MGVQLPSVITSPALERALWRPPSEDNSLEFDTTHEALGRYRRHGNAYQRANRASDRVQPFTG